jgi:hypothetical protein
VDVAARLAEEGGEATAEPDPAEPAEGRPDAPGEGR